MKTINESSEDEAKPCMCVFEIDASLGPNGEVEIYLSASTI